MIELLVYTIASLFVLTAVVTFLLTTFDQQNQISSRAVATDQAEQGLEQLVADLRQAMGTVSISNPTTSTTQISFSLPTPGTPTTPEGVTWTCPSTGASTTSVTGVCARVLTPGGGGTVTKTEISGVESMAFAPISSTGAALTLPVSGSTSVASVGMTLKVQLTNYGQGTDNSSSQPGSNPSSILPGASGSPILLQATADLENFS